MKILMTAESTCDLTKAQIEENKIKIMPLIINLGEDSFIDSVNIQSNDIFNYVSKTGILPKTAARGIYEYQEFFVDALKSCDAIIHISLSSEMSSSYNNALAASKNYKNVFVVDSRSLSTGYGLLVLSGIDMINAGMPAKEIYEKLTELTKKIHASFIINNLKYLYKGGRCSAIALLGSNILKIKPCIEIKEGSMGVGKKYIGKLNDVLIKYVKDLLKAHQDINKKHCFITYSSSEEIEIHKIREILLDHGFENVYESTAGCTIASHCGPQTLGVLFINN
ncbi:MAG: DegV family protein [Clostridia bacterium]